MLAGSEQLIEQQVAIGHLRFPAIQNQFALQPRLRGGSGGLTTMIRLRSACGYKGVGTVCQRVTHQKLQFASFVSTEGQPRLIIAFDEQFRPAEFASEGFEFLDGSWQVRQPKTRQRVNSHVRYVAAKGWLRQRTAGLPSWSPTD